MNEKLKTINSIDEYIEFVGECLDGWKDAGQCKHSRTRLMEIFGSPVSYPCEVKFTYELEDDDERPWMKPVFGTDVQVTTFLPFKR